MVRVDIFEVEFFMKPTFLFSKAVKQWEMRCRSNLPATASNTTKLKTKSPKAWRKLRDNVMKKIIEHPAPEKLSFFEPPPKKKLPSFFFTRCEKFVWLFFSWWGKTGKKKYPNIPQPRIHQVIFKDIKIWKESKLVGFSTTYSMYNVYFPTFSP